MDAFLIRTEFTNTHTCGMLAIDGVVFHTIERAWLNNQANVSCIPDGDYKCLPLERSNSGKYRNIFYVSKVTDRTGILIHNGNLASHSRGCIIIGKRKGVLNNQPAVLNSNTAKNELWEIAPDGFNLRIYGVKKCLIQS